MKISKNRNWLLVSMCTSLLFGACKTEKSERKPLSESSQAEEVVSGLQTKIHEISVIQLHSLGNTITLIDVRSPKEFNAGHIPYAKNINFYDGNFAENFKDFDKSKPIYLICHSGGRSERTSKELKKLGFEDVYNVEGGMMAWEKQKYPVTK